MDPLIADWQHECEAASARTRAMRVWTRVRGLVVLWKALLVHTALVGWRELGEDQPPFHWDLHRGLGAGTAAGFVGLALAAFAYQVSLVRRLDLGIGTLTCLVPSVVVISLPASFFLGAWLAVGRVRARLRTWRECARAVRNVVAAAGVGAIVTLAFTAWVVPSANQAYRQAVYFAATGARQPLAKGDRELTFGELSAAAERHLADLGPAAAAPYEVERQKRLALPAACVVFALLGSSFGLNARRLRPAVMVLTWLPVSALYFACFRIGEQAGDRLLVPAIIAIWAPNLALALAGLAGVLHGGPGRATPPGSLPDDVDADLTSV